MKLPDRLALAGAASGLAVMGGFESACHRVQGGRQVDSIAASGHDRHAATDYAALADAGIRLARDALRWHLVEASAGARDWRSADCLIDAAANAGVGVIWDLCHWGWPVGLDIWAPDFVHRFADFADAAVQRLRARGGHVAGIIPINEISFWAWAGGQHPGFAPHGSGQGDQLKRQLVRAWLAAERRIRAIDPAIPLITSEPLVVTHPNPGKVRLSDVRNAQAGMYEAWDMLLGLREPELGGHAQGFDLMGLNWYPENQWRHMGRMLKLDDPRRVPLSDLLVALHRRYGRPILLTETGREEPHGAAWLTATLHECRIAQQQGASVLGACIYPVMDYPGWDDARHCPCGLIEVDAAWQRRRVRAGMLAAMDGSTAAVAATCPQAAG